MLAAVAFVLIAISPTSGVGMQEFDDEKACKNAMGIVVYDSTAKRFRGVDAYCLPKSTQPAQPVEEPKK